MDARNGAASRSRLPRRAGLLTLFGLAGEAVLNFLGISMPAFRIAGGVLLFLTALDMLFERRTQRRQGQADTAHADDPSVFPLAIPLIAGPGGHRHDDPADRSGRGDAVHIALVHGVMALVLACVFGAVPAGGPSRTAAGPTGINVVTRLLGMLLAALSVQFVIDGMRDLQVI
jgi:multiple antibiotic resistance protein